MKKDDDEDILKDGETFRVPMYMLDSVQRELADRQRRIDQIETYNKRISNAWRHGSEAASYDAKIQERWKGAA